MEIYAAVNQMETQRFLLECSKLGILKKNVKCLKKLGKVLIPLCMKPWTNDNLVHLGNDKWERSGIIFEVYENRNCDFPKRMLPKHMKLNKHLKSLLESKGLWSNDLEDEIPKSWDKFGNILIFDQDKYFRSARWDLISPELWIVIGKTMDVKTIALRGKIHDDKFRSPNVELVWGNNPWADFKDNGIRFSWDVTKVMFSPGNVTERHRMGRTARDGEIVVDLFSGIGYFTLPILVNSETSFVHACEWNPHAVMALRKNLTQNGVAERCVIHEGDCREVELSDVADRVILGLLPSSQCGWEKACQVLKPSGGILHIHENVTSGLGTCVSDACAECQQLMPVSYEDGGVALVDGALVAVDRVVRYKQREKRMWAVHMLHTIRNAARSVKGGGQDWGTEILQFTHVKSYAPHIHHLVLDLRLFKL